jgi:hypothetical protein
MSTRATQFFEQSRKRLQEDPIPEIQRRLAAIHSVVTETTDDDRGIRGWSAEQLMQLMTDIDTAVQAKRPTKKTSVG